MKKIFIIIFLSLFCTTMADAQVKADSYSIPTHSINVTVADGTGEAFIGIFADVMAAIVKAMFGQSTSSEITGWTPYMSVGYMYHFNDTRWSVGPEVGYWHMSINDVDNDYKININNASLVASGTFFYKPKGICKLYGNLCAGAGLLFSNSEPSVYPAIQINPIGMRLGSEKVAFVAELGAGYKGILQLGVNVGL